MKPETKQLIESLRDGLKGSGRYFMAKLALETATAEVESGLILNTLIEADKTGYWLNFLRNPNLREAMPSDKLEELLVGGGILLARGIQDPQKEDVLNIGLIVAQTPSLCRIMGYSTFLNATKNYSNVIDCVMKSPEFLSHCDSMALNGLLTRYPSWQQDLAKSLLQLFDNNQGNSRENERVRLATTMILTKWFLNNPIFRECLLRGSNHFNYLDRKAISKAVSSDFIMRGVVNGNLVLFATIYPDNTSDIDNTLDALIDNLNMGVTTHFNYIRDGKTGASSSSNNVNNNAAASKNPDIDSNTNTKNFDF